MAPDRTRRLRDVKKKRRASCPESVLARRSSLEARTGFLMRVCVGDLRWKAVRGVVDDAASTIAPG